MKSDTFFIALITCTVLMLSGASGCTPSKEKGNPSSLSLSASASGAVLSFVKGSVTADGIVLEPGETVKNGATVVTGKDSGCEIVFNERNVLSLSAETIIRIDLSKTVKELDVIDGTLKAVLLKLDKIADSDSLKVNGSNAVLGVRGTVFCVHAEPGETYVCACNGEVRVADELGTNEETLSYAHHGSRIFTTSGDKINSVADGLLYHSDADMEALASGIGYAINWNTIGK